MPGFRGNCSQIWSLWRQTWIHGLFNSTNPILTSRLTQHQLNMDSHQILTFLWTVKLWLKILLWSVLQQGRSPQPFVRRFRLRIITEGTDKVYGKQTILITRIFAIPVSIKLRDILNLHASHSHFPIYCKQFCIKPC